MRFFLPPDALLPKHRGQQGGDDRNVGETISRQKKSSSRKGITARAMQVRGRLVMKVAS